MTRSLSPSFSMRAGTVTALALIFAFACESGTEFAPPSDLIPTGGTTGSGGSAGTPSVVPGDNVDLNNDGTPDGIAVDDDGDGVVDAVDTDGDGEGDVPYTPPLTGDGDMGDGDMGDGDMGDGDMGDGDMGDGDTGDGDGDMNGDGDDFDPFAGATPVTGPDEPDEGPAQCAEDAEWGNATLVDGLESGPGDRLLSITPDELTIIFLKADSPVISDREDILDPWPTPTALTLPSGYDAELGIGIEPSGLGLVLVEEDGDGLGRVSRANRTSSFGTSVDADIFEQINTVVEMTQMTVSSPVVTDNGSELWWVEHWTDSAIYKGSYDGFSDVNREHVGCDERGACNLLLDGIGGVDNLISGVSFDLRTIFMDFEEDGPKMMFRDYVELKAPFFDEIGLASRVSPQTNTDCSRLYYSNSMGIYYDILLP